MIHACLTQHGECELHVVDGTLSAEGDQELAVATVYQATANVHTVAHERFGQHWQTASLSVSARINERHMNGIELLWRCEINFQD